MKTDIHPKYHQAKVTCACGNVFTVGSTLSELQVDICSACHPFFTGKMRYIDALGRVDKFMAKRKKATKYQKKDKKKTLQEENTQAKSLKEMLTVTPTKSK